MKPDNEKTYAPEHVIALRLLALIPVLAAIGAICVFFFVKHTHPVMQQWAGVPLIEPIAAATVYEDNGEALFETQRPQPVRASIAGVISSVSERKLEIGDGPVTVSYRGLTTDNVETGQRVTSGEVVGKLEVGRPDPRFARLWIKVVRNNHLVIPTLKSRFGTEAQRILALSCTGCHQMRDVYPLADGKMRNGEPATEQTVAASIRTGGKPKGPFGMPAFNTDTLSDDELQAVVSYLCRSQCGSTVARVDQ